MIELRPDGYSARVKDYGTEPRQIRRKNSAAATGVPDAELALAAGAVFFAPMNFLRYPDFYVTLSDVLAFACLFLMLLNRTVPLRPFRHATLLWYCGLFLLAAALMISSFVNGDAVRGVIVSSQYLYTFLVLPLIILGRSRDQAVMLVKVFVLSIALMCIHGVYLIHIDGQTNTRFVSGSGRLLGFVERDNECASVIAMTFPLVLWLAHAGAIRQITAWATFLLLGYGVILTGSNTGLLTSVCAIGIYTLATLSWSRFIVGAAGAGVIVAFVRNWGEDYLPAVFQRRVLAALKSGDVEVAGTFLDRMDLVVESIGKAGHTIFLGLGADQYRVWSASGHPVHNIYLLIWTEGGLVALFGFILILVAGLVTAIGAYRNRSAWPSVVCALTTVTAFALLGNAVPHVYGRFWLVPVLLAISLSLAHGSRGDIPRASHHQFG